MLLGQANNTSDPATQKTDFGWLNDWIEQVIPQSEIRWVVWIAGVAILIAIAVYLVSKIRNFGMPDDSASEDLVEFNELYERGAFSDDEMAKLKQTIRSIYEDGAREDFPVGEKSVENPSTNKPN